ncbi:MAG TPA: L,D-transpeptidase family protein [Mucilaginibacter sp.]|nr:L,D-transpeptidase family protein [Mucilaginibacter sp.]
METAKQAKNLRRWKKAGIFFAGCLGWLYLSSYTTANHPGRQETVTGITQPDSAIAGAIKAQLSDVKGQATLHFPKSVARFYNQSGFNAAWVEKVENPTQTWEAMLMLDCVLQFGLSHDDYHPRELSYGLLHTILEKPTQVSAAEKAKYDILLTDALVTFTDHLHYGKLNPDFPAPKIDEGIPGGFNGDEALRAAISQPDFMKALIGVQPQSKAYADLQYHMHLLEGVYQGDCYDIPEETVRKMAINMERLRWASLNDSSYIQVNIPSFNLKYHLPDTTYEFKTVVGKPDWPTPTVNSAITYFTTAPEWRVPKKIFIKELLPKALKNPDFFESNQYALYDKQGNYVEADANTLAMVKQNPGNYSLRQSSGCDNSLGLIVFRFPNIFDIYLHDTPEKKYFKADERDFSHGCIRVEHAEKLADLILTRDGSENLIGVVHKAIAGYKTKDFKLNKPIPIKVTYITCEMQKGTLVTYKDIYDLDKRLEMVLYNVTNPLALN